MTDYFEEPDYFEVPDLIAELSDRDYEDKRDSKGEEEVELILTDEWKPRKCLFYPEKDCHRCSCFKE